MSAILLDTGPLVAFLNRHDAHHSWARAQFEQLPLPFLTCEAVLTEAAHLIERRAGLKADQLVAMMRAGAFRVDFQMAMHGSSLEALLRKYRDRPMDLADACLVRMAELYPQSRVLTLDVGDFSIYRVHQRQHISMIAPGQQAS